MTTPNPTSLESTNLKTFQVFMERVNAGQFDELDELVHPDYVGHVPFPTPAPGFAGEKMVYQANLQALPDIRFFATATIAEGEYVAGLGGVSGTHTGTEMFGVPARGTALQWDAIDVARFQDGKIVERWLESDAASLFRQLGIMPGPTETLEMPVAPTGSGAAYTSPEENKATMRRFIEEVWNQGKLEVADEIFHPEASSPSARQLPRGGAGVKLIAQMFRAAFPDYHMKIDFMVAEGNWICARFTQSGTQHGELMGLPASGKYAEWTELGVLRFEGGVVVESWYQANMLSLMQQLGVSMG